MQGKISYGFSVKMWQHTSTGGWYFVSLPVEISEDIRANLKFQEEGWGRMKALVKTGIVQWHTAIWFDTTHMTYLLPIKASIRRDLRLGLQSEIKIKIYL